MKWMRRQTGIAMAVFGLCIVISYSINDVTGRFQLLFLPEPRLKSMAMQEYRQFLKENKVLKQDSSVNVAMVMRVGKNLTKAIEKLYATNASISRQLKEYEWEYCVVESPEINAWCLPGGKIIVYSGLLSITRNESSLAIVMGHEIAHALARHGNERMSYSLLLSGIGIVGQIMLSVNQPVLETFKRVFPMAGRYYALLPALREQEVEADKFGLVFAAAAGYDPSEAIALWSRMHQTSDGRSIPDFNSTHPSEKTRIAELVKFMPIALQFSQKKKEIKIR